MAYTNLADVRDLKDPVEVLLTKSHIEIIKNPYTSGYCGSLFIGTSEIVDEAAACPTAYTDGRNKFYGREFVLRKASKLSKMIGLVLHENLHVLLLHVIRLEKEFKEDAQTANAAADYAVNAIIMHISDQTKLPNGQRWCELPEGGLYDPMFKGWSVREIFDYLTKGKIPPQAQQGGKPGKQGQQGGGSQPQPGGGSQTATPPQKGTDAEGNPTVTVEGKTFGLKGHDDHSKLQAGKLPAPGKDDKSAGSPGEPSVSPPVDDAAEKAKAQAALEREVMDAIQQGKLIAGKLGAKMPRAIEDTIKPKVDWRRETDEFAAEFMHGRGTVSWRRFNKHRLADDMYFPGIISEAMGELVIGIDTSGSIRQPQLSEFAGHLVEICKLREPRLVRVLWWDTMVHAEQIFGREDYADIAKLLKPQGGGGTTAGCVSRYLIDNQIDAQAVIMFTDGYCEPKIQWDTPTPTLWLVTSRHDFTPPEGGRVVAMED